MTHTTYDLDRAVDAFMAGGLASADPAIRADPHPLYHRLRELGPRYIEEYEEWVFTRWDHCEQILRDPRFSSDPAHRISARPLEERTFREQFQESSEFRTLLFMDPPDHTRIRGLVNKAFTPRAVERIRSHITEICDGILDDAAAAGVLDVVGDLGYRLPVTVICELLGVPAGDQAQFGPWSSALSRLLDGDISDDLLAAGLEAFMHILAYLNDIIDERRAQPRDDLISALIAAEDAGDRLSDTELRSMIILLFVAGHETTTNLIGNGTWALLSNPDQLHRLRADPTLVTSAVEELLRYNGPVHLTGRIATADVEVGGIEIPAGTQVVTLLAAANRDPAQFPDPDRLDIGRDPNHHLSFSHGIHYCLGAALARAEGQIAIGSLVSRFDRIEPLEAPTYRDHFVLRGFNSLNVAVA